MNDWNAVDEMDREQSSFVSKNHGRRKKKLNYRNWRSKGGEIKAVRGFAWASPLFSSFGII